MRRIAPDRLEVGDEEREEAMTALTKKQETFALAYIKGLNASGAYRLAYGTKNMSPKTINECASRLLADRKVTARIDELRVPALAAAGIETERTLRERTEGTVTLLMAGLLLGGVSSSAIWLPARPGSPLTGS